jgi:deoxyribose-phosphate aldolase|tara:strand:- start:846 stop:1427 length:582 start_codon:yes stop_codon:yes gene_type:complete
MKAIFVASDKDISSVAIPSGFMGRVNDFLKDQKFSAAIDFPYGLSGTQVRLHEIILAIRQGASFIDLVINNGYIKEGNWSKIREDLKVCLSICKERDVELRALIEYRLFPLKTVLMMCELLKINDVHHVVNSTGFIVDDISDNAIASYQMQEKTGVLVTSCVRAFTAPQIKTFEDVDIHALRLMSTKIVEDLL